MNFYTKKTFGMAQARQNFLWKRVLIASAILVGVIVVLNIFQVSVKNSFYVTSEPFLKGFFRVSRFLANEFNSLFAYQSIQKENDNIKEENQKLISRVIFLEKSFQEARLSKEAAEVGKANNFTMIMAETVGLDLQYDTILVNKGFEDGIKENMPVISAAKVLYGKISKVYKNFSEVTLISSKKSALAVKISQLPDNQDFLVQQGQPINNMRGPIFGVLKGNGNLSVYMDLVNTDAQIKEGDALLTSGQEGIFPKDLLVGKVVAVNKNDAKAFQDATVGPLFDPKNTENLFVITNYLKR